MNSAGGPLDANLETRKLNLAIQKEPHRKRDLTIAWYERLVTEYGAEQAEFAAHMMHIVTTREEPLNGPTRAAMPDPKPQLVPPAASPPPAAPDTGSRKRPGVFRMKWAIPVILLAGVALGAYMMTRASADEPTLEEAGPHPHFWDKLPKPGQNNVWYERNDAKTVIVFVHGIFSDSRGCWLAVDSKDQTRSQYWPALISGDARLEHPSVFLGGYATSMDSGPYDMRQAAGELRDALKRENVLQKERIIFIAHSTGGIVARFLLFHNQDLFRGKAIGLVLYASPSVGSPFASMLSFLSEFYNNQLGLQLKPDNPQLIELDKDFRELLYNPNSDPDNLKIVGAEGVENFFILHRRFLPDKKLVVPESSASHYFGAPVYLRGTNHFTTVKPPGIDHPGHELLITFYNKYKKDFRFDSPAPRGAAPVFTTEFTDKNDAGQPYVDVQVVDKNAKYTQPPKPAGDNGHELIVDLAAPGPITDVAFRAEGEGAGWTHQTALNITETTARWTGWSNSGAPAQLVFTIKYKRAHQVCIKNCQ